MKKLYLVRHAKSSWDDAQLKDIDRPLNERGATDAPRMGQVLKSRGVSPHLIATSPALRAATTAMIIAEALVGSDKVQIDARLYRSNTRELFNLVRNLPPSIHSAMWIGHNPAFTDFANELIPDEIDNIPTCGIVAITFPVSEWGKISKNTGELMFFERPKKAGK